MLIFLQSQGMINLDDVRNKMKETERQRLLSQHKYKIFQDKDGRWKTTILDPSKKTGRRLIAKTHLHDLEDAIIASYSAVEDEKYIKENIYTLETIFPLWLKYKASQTNATSYARRILVDWDKYYKNTSITQIALVDLTYLTLNEWAHNLIKKYSLTKKQYYNMSIIMRQCLDYACEPELNLLKDNPFRRVRIKSNLFTRKEKPKSNTQVFIVNEQQKICETAKKKIAEHPWCTTPLMILLNFQLGLRISEICAIKWSDIEDNYIHIQRMEVEDYTIKEIDGELKSISNGYTIVPYTKSVAGDRKVYLNESAKKILRQIKKTNMEYGYYDQDFIFIKSQGCIRGTTSAFSQYLTDLCVEAGVMKKSSHKIRKTYISSLFDQKININTIREQAGHEDEQTSLNNYCFDQNTDRVIEDKLEHAANQNVCI